MPSYEQSKSSKLWSVRFRELGDDGLMHNKRLSGYKTKKQAQFAYEDYTVEQKRKAETAANHPKHAKAPEDSPDDLFFDDLVAAYLKYQKGRVKESSLIAIESRFTKITPHFLGMTMDEIKPITILEWQQKLAEEGYSYSYRSTLVTALSSLYRYGVKYHDITDIMPKVDRPRNLEGKKEMLFWTPDEFKQFIECVEDPVYATLFWMLYITGCRKGEALAIQWKDVDLNAATVSISKTVTNKVKGAAYAITTPKNASSNRTVTLPPFFTEMLKEFKDNTPDATPESFVFHGSRPLPLKNVERRFGEGIQKSGVKRIRIHDLRHSCASLLISSGATIVSISNRLGHSNIEQTLNTYAHMMPDDQTLIGNALEKIGTTF